jgi:asparagine synthase (glutamine-hydrolysing)
MTLFAGIFKRNKEGELPRAACDTLRSVISRDPRAKDQTSVFEDERCFFAHVDIGAYGEAGFRVDNDGAGAVSMLAGEPLLRLSEEDAWQSRAKDLDVLHEDWLKGSWETLRSARGVFCAAHYQAKKGELSLIADKLCVRPLYYWADERYVVFATALRILESLALVPKEMDVRAVTEVVGFSLPLGTRTPYKNVRLLRAGEVARFDAHSASREQYWRWDEITVSARPEEELAREAYERFMRAVKRRIGRDRATFAFLSGGLDSRAVVGALRSLGTRLHTFNFSPKGSQDQIFGAEFAKKIGAVHAEAQRRDEGGPDWAQMLVDGWGEVQAREQEEPAERPMLGWSGDGGSVGLGHVYMSREIVHLMRKGERDAAIDAYLRAEKASIPERFFKEDVAARLSGSLHRGIREELDDIHCDDAGRSFHLFLMLNDQRRHLARHFENIDRHHLELHLPFYDSDFLSLILSVPVDLCLEHKFYAKFLARFPAVVTSVPWQAYPGHEPCPLPVPQELTYQWSADAGKDVRESAARKRQLLKQAGELLASPDFPGKILDRGKFRLATLLHRTGVRDLGHVIESAEVYHKYWALCGGRYVLPSSQESEDSRPALKSLPKAGETMMGADITGQ